MKMNSKHQFAITVSALVLSFVLIDYLTVQVQSSGQQTPPSDAASLKDNKRAALRDSLRKASLKRLRADRWAQFGARDPYELSDTDMPARPTLGATVSLLNRSNLSDDQTRVIVRDIGPEFGASFSAAGFVFNREDPRQIILPAEGRVFRSLNGGVSWSPVEILTDRGFTTGTFFVRQDPHNSRVLFAVTPFSHSLPAVYRSQDFGTTWTLVEGDFPFFIPADVADIAIHEGSSNVILVLTQFSEEATLWKSVDGGTTFEPQFDSGLPIAIFDSEIFDYVAFPIYTNIATTPADPNVVYVVQNSDPLGYYPPSIYKSVNGGETFVRLEGGPPEPLQVFPHPTNPNVLFVQDQSDINSPGIYRSTDGGSSFEPLAAGLPPDKWNFFVALDVHNASFVYVAGEGGFFLSTDGGDTFERLGLTDEELGLGATTASVDPSDPDTIYVNTNRGNFKSVNGGITFHSINNGWKAAFANHIAFDNASQPNLYIAAPFGIGILRTRARGNHYEPLPHPAGAGELTNGAPWPILLTIAPNDPNLILAGTRNAGLFRSSDAGISWAPASINTGQTRFSNGDSEIVIDPVNANSIYLANGNPGFEGFYRSTDEGQTFQRTYFVAMNSTRSRLNDLAIDPLNPNVIYSGSRVVLTGGVLLKSTDGGQSFTSTRLGISSAITDIAVDPINSNNVYLAGRFRLSSQSIANNLVRSPDAGATILAADAGLTGGIIGIVFDPQDPARLYAWTQSGLFMTTDGATTWTLLEGDKTVKAAGYGNTIVINPKKPNLLYLAGATVLEVEIR